MAENENVNVNVNVNINVNEKYKCKNKFDLLIYLQQTEIMFQQFENNLNSYMTEKVKEVAGAAEEIFQTAGIIQEQELKIKSLQKSKKSLKKQVQDLEKELEEEIQN